MLCKLHEAGVRGHLHRGIAATYNRVTSRITVEGHNSEPYNIELGVREGSVLSPIVYITFLNGLLERLHNHGADLVAVAGDPTIKLAGMGYADDLVITSTTPEGLQAALDIAGQYAKEHCFQYAYKKSNIVIFGGDADAPEREWTLQALHHEQPNDPANTNTLKCVKQYTYLGTEFHQDRTWAAQFRAAAQKFQSTAADKWEDAGGVALGADAIVSNKLFGALVEPAVDKNPLTVANTIANATTIKQAKPLHDITKAAQQAAVGGAYL
eukprot:g4677.t1